MPLERLPTIPSRLSLARRLVWFELPQHALAELGRLLACAFALARPADMRPTPALR
ncbi:MAG: hypothetical protein HYV17_03670 [Xanthomonadales bacterium]|nr:hypothetical protein [Xanthomonadales bacterium]